MQLGMTMAEYERSVGPKNKHFHERAEARYLQRQGIIPYEDEDRKSRHSDAHDIGTTKVRGTSDSGFKTKRIEKPDV